VLIAELYSSLQGEGLLTGTPSVFVRASGCNLRCWFCDTPYTSWQPEGEDWSVEAIVEEVMRLADAAEIPMPLGETVGWDKLAQASAGPPESGRWAGGRSASLSHPTSIRHVVITGGEPMLYAELIPLTQRLHEAGLHITIETAGTLFLPVACDLMSISPKLASSTPTDDRAGRWAARHEHTRHRADVIQRLTNDYNYQLKFVIDTPADLEEVNRWLAEFPDVDRRRVLLMPQGTNVAGLARIGEWLQPYCDEHGFVFCPRRHIEWYGARRGT
jgi:7-carboxy-7-deazaguanine synthase